ncbi:MAG TPA: hypothetical protein VE650_05755 [Acetobacteraceae bacterium]|nr:hypothetical protein [Acetobacteraceae bacterium]
MSEQTSPVILRPRHCRVSASPNRTEVALTFSVEGRPPMIVVLPAAGAARFQRNLAQSLLLLSAQTPAANPQPPVSPQPAEASA